jgi:hypothetical protein
VLIKSGVSGIEEMGEEMRKVVKDGDFCVPSH